MRNEANPDGRDDGVGWVCVNRRSSLDAGASWIVDLPVSARRRAKDTAAGSAMQRIKTYFPLATITGTLTGLGLVGVAIEPGSIALIGVGSAMIAAARG